MDKGIGLFGSTSDFFLYKHKYETVVVSSPPPTLLYVINLFVEKNIVQKFILQFEEYEILALKYKKFNLEWHNSE